MFHRKIKTYKLPSPKVERYKLEKVHNPGPPKGFTLSLKTRLQRLKPLAVPTIGAVSMALGAPKSVSLMLPFLFQSADSTQALSFLSGDPVDFVSVIIVLFNLVIIPLLAAWLHKYDKLINQVWGIIRLYGQAKTLESDGGRKVTKQELESILHEAKELLEIHFKEAK